MPLVLCKDCRGEMSDKAAVCPKCGAPNDGGVPIPLSYYSQKEKKPVKWWLWIPLGLVAAFLAFGFSIPKYEGTALAERRACEKMAGGAYHLLRQCDQNYSEAMARGRNTR